MLRIDDLTYRIQGRVLFDGACATIGPGAKIGMVGRNGSGKTTLFGLISGELAVDSGSIKVRRSAKLGMVAQEAPGGSESLLEAVLAADVERASLLAEAETKDAQEDEAFGKDKRGDELPEDLRTREGRLNRLREAGERLKQERIAAENEQRDKLAQREQREQETGRKMRGRQPKSVEDVRAEQAKRKANATAPETRAMKTQSGYLQGFNAQAVCTDQQIILAPEVTDQENDQGQYHPMMDAAQANATAALGEKEGTIKLGRSDAGYCNQVDLERECNYEILMATSKDWRRRQELREQPPPRGRAKGSGKTTPVIKGQRLAG